MPGFSEKALQRALVVLALTIASTLANGARSETFDAFTAALWKDAQAQGITRATFDAALAGVTPDERVIGSMQRQPEYGKPFGAYVDSMVSASRLATATRKSAQWAGTLRAVENKFGVPAPILVSIWGIESSFGEAQDRWDVFARSRRWPRRTFRNLISAMSCSARSEYFNRTISRASNSLVRLPARWARRSSCHQAF